jgi:hypothetical protein
MITRLLSSIAARILSKRAHQTSHDRIVAKTVAMRRELGLGEHPGLRAG